MDPAYLNPIMPVFPDVGPALVVPVVLAGLAGCLGLGAILVLVIRGDAVRQRDVTAILDVDAPPMLDPEGPRRRRRSSRRSFVQRVRREVVDAVPLADS